MAWKTVSNDHQLEVGGSYRTTLHLRTPYRQNIAETIMRGFLLLNKVPLRAFEITKVVLLAPRDARLPRTVTPGLWGYIVYWKPLKAAS